MLSFLLGAQIGSAGSLDLDEDERQMLDSLLAWTPAFREDCLSGTVHADTKLLGTDLLNLSVLLGNTEAASILLEGMRQPAGQERLAGLLVSAVRSGDDSSARMLGRQGAQITPDAVEALLEHHARPDKAMLDLLISNARLSDVPGEWISSLALLLPQVSTEQLNQLLAPGTHWDYTVYCGDGLLEACLQDSAKLNSLLGSGFDLSKFARSMPDDPLVEVCRAYRRQRSRLQLQSAELGRARLELSSLGLAMTTTELLERLQKVKAFGRLDLERPEERGYLTGPEYTVTSAVPDMRFYRMLRSMGMDLNATDGDGNNALNLLTVQGLLSDKELQELVGMGMDPLMPNFLSRSALHAAILSGRDDLVDQWLGKARIPQPMALVALGRIAEFDAAVQALGLDEEKAANEFEKGMLLAGQSGRKDSIKAVMAAGRAPLMQAMVMLEMDSEIGKAFFDQNILISENLSVDSSLTIAVRRQDLGLLEFLFSLLPHDQHWLEEAQDQALQQAATIADRRFMEAILDYGAPVERPSQGGVTALVRACSAGQIDNVRFLLRGGADPGHGLDYFAGQEGPAPADWPAARTQIVAELLRSFNPERPGLSSKWRGEETALLVAMASWPDAEAAQVAEVAGFSDDAACQAAMSACIEYGRSELLASIVDSGVAQLSSVDQQQLVSLCLRRAQRPCLDVLLAAGFSLPGPGDSVRMLSQGS